MHAIIHATLYVTLFFLILAAIACAIGIGCTLFIKDEPTTCTPLDLLERKD